MKKKPVPTGEEEGWINQDPRDSEMYFSIASHSGLERLYNRLPGSGRAAEHRPAAQWHSHKNDEGEERVSAAWKTSP